MINKKYKYKNKTTLVKNLKKKKSYFLYKKTVKLSRIWIRCFFKPGFKKIYKKFRKNYFVWRKKKKRKSIKHKHNFIFFFTKKRKRWPRIAFRWLKFQLSRFKKTPLELLHDIENKRSFDFKRRYPLRLKNKVLKKRALKLKLKHYYRIKENVWTSITKLIKKKKNKINYLFFFLEFRLSTVCVRFHFFWSLRRAHFWISKGAIGVNNLSISTLNYRIQINDFIRVLGPKALWLNKLMRAGGYYFHSRFYKTFNYSETSYKSRSGIVLKVPTQINEFRALVRRRRKSWIKLKTFLYLVNSFY